MSNIILYTTPTCAYCHMVKKYFEDNEVEYDTKDITLDANAYQEILDKSSQIGTPVIDIDGEVVVGWNKSKIDEVLKAKEII